MWVAVSLTPLSQKYMTARLAQISKFLSSFYYFLIGSFSPASDGRGTRNYKIIEVHTQSNWNPRTPVDYRKSRDDHLDKQIAFNVVT